MMAFANFPILKCGNEGDEIMYDFIFFLLLLKVEIIVQVCGSFPTKVVQSCSFVLNSCLCLVIQIVVDSMRIS